MKHRRPALSRLLIYAAGLACAQTAAASPPAASGEVVETVDGWQIRDEQGHCSAAMPQAGGIHVAVTFDVYRLFFGTLQVFNPAWKPIRDEQRYEASLVFSNGRVYDDLEAIAIRSDRGAAPGTEYHISIDLNRFFEDLTDGAPVVVMLGELPLETLSLRGTRAVAERLASCAEASSVRHPFEFSPSPPSPTAAEHPPRPGPSPPVQLSGTITNDDYPASAVRLKAEGSVEITVTVGADGRIADCTVSESSGSASLDSTTCSLARRRFLYDPARDARGNAVPGSVTRRVRWSLRERERERSVRPE
jgi:TonB family protein